MFSTRRSIRDGEVMRDEHYDRTHDPNFEPPPPLGFCTRGKEGGWADRSYFDRPRRRRRLPQFPVNGRTGALCATITLFLVISNNAIKYNSRADTVSTISEQVLKFSFKGKIFTRSDGI